MWYWKTQTQRALERYSNISLQAPWIATLLKWLWQSWAEQVPGRSGPQPTASSVGWRILHWIEEPDLWLVAGTLPVHMFWGKRTPPPSNLPQYYPELKCRSDAWKKKWGGQWCLLAPAFFSQGGLWRCSHLYGGVAINGKLATLKSLLGFNTSRPILSFFFFKNLNEQA